MSTGKNSAVEFLLTEVLVTYGRHDQLHSLHSFEGIQGPEVKNVFEKFKPRFLNDPLFFQLDKNRSVCKPLLCHWQQSVLLFLSDFSDLGRGKLLTPVAWCCPLSSSMVTVNTIIIFFSLKYIRRILEHLQFMVKFFKFLILKRESEA